MSGYGPDYVLDGPKTPYWGCSKCGVDRNWASRIKCRCGVTAATNIVQAAKRNATIANLHPKTAPKSKDHSKEIAGLRRELERLRASGGDGQIADDSEDVQDDSVVEVDVRKAQVVYDALVATYGAESRQAKEVAVDLEALRRSKREPKPVPLQFRAVERRVVQKEKAIENARIAAAEAVRAAQRALDAAEKKVELCQQQWFEVED